MGSSSLSLALGGLRFPNVAAGSFLVLSSITVYELIYRFNLDFFSSMMITLLIFLLIYLLLDKVLFNRYYKQLDPTLQYLIISIGIIIVVGGLFDVVFSHNPRILETQYKNLKFNIANLIYINAAHILSLTVTYLLILIFIYFMRFTRLGMALRALVQDKEAALLMGIDVVRVSRIGYIVSSLLVTVSGCLYALMYSFDSSLISLGFVFLTIAIVGGPGSILGSALTGLIYGFINATISVINPYWTIFVFYGILCVVLLFKPLGLFSR